jgi:hypothetical protein
MYARLDGRMKRKEKSDSASRSSLRGVYTPFPSSMAMTLVHSTDGPVQTHELEVTSLPHSTCPSIMFETSSLNEITFCLKYLK